MVDFVLDFELSRDYWVLLLVLLATYVIISIVYAILNLVYRSIRPLLIVALIAVRSHIVLLYTSHNFS